MSTSRIVVVEDNVQYHLVAEMSDYTFNAALNEKAKDRWEPIHAPFVFDSKVCQLMVKRRLA